MKTSQELYNERLNRIKTAIALEKPDQTPVVLMGDAYFARQAGVKLFDFCTKLEVSHETQKKGIVALGVDGVEIPFLQYSAFRACWYSNMKLPGRHLPESALWQMDEAELMTIEDYDRIINEGFYNFSSDFYINRLDNSVTDCMSDLQDIAGSLGKFAQSYADAGVVAFCPVVTQVPMEYFTGGRSMPKFIRDLYKIPDKVQEALDAAMPEYIEVLRAQIQEVKPVAVWVNGMRSNSSFLSRKLWERFVWPYLKKIAEVIVEEGSYAYFHNDGDWERDLEFFCELPKRKCVFGPDGTMNIYKVKEVLGDRMCIMGDVPPALLALGTPDEVYNYATKIIKDIGPGLILSQGCDIPPNAKPENVKAMVSAATGK